MMEILFSQQDVLVHIIVLTQHCIHENKILVVGAFLFLCIRRVNIITRQLISLENFHCNS